MKKILYLSLTSLLTSCLTEKNADPGTPSTFVRYFNGGNDDFAQVAEETSDKGIIILGTTEITDEDLTKRYKIKLVKTDAYGNVIWSNVYPADFAKTADNLRGRSLLQLSTGSFIVIGESVLPAKSGMHILEVSADGAIVTQKTINFDPLFDPSITPSTFSIQGQAIQVNSNGNYLVLGAVPNETEDMLLAELDKSTLEPIWVKSYGAGVSISLSNKIFLDAADYVFWSGTVKKIAPAAKIRLVKTAQNSLLALSDLDIIGPTEYEETGNDICRYGNGFAVVGSTNQKTLPKTGVDEDILFKILADDGSVLYSNNLDPFGFGDTDVGNSITTVRGGLAILGTAKTVPATEGGRGLEDYYLIKVDAFGNKVWGPSPRIFGSKNKDTGASVRQMSDGSLLVLGTTDFGGVNTMMLMKTDSEGNIE